MESVKFPEHLLEPPLAGPTGLTLRLATAVDGETLRLNLYAHKTAVAFWRHFEQVLAWQENGRAVWLLAEQGGRTVGCGELLIYPHGAELANIFVVATHRGRGVGTTLLIVLLRLARYLGETAVEIGVIPDNDRARRLYERLGFGQERTIRLAGGETAVILRREL